VVFFGAVGSDFTPAGLEHGLTAAAGVSIVGYAACALATLLLPSRAAVRAHAEHERALLSATP
jgi:hypothetical protein